jgi:hypothetical protein
LEIQEHVPKDQLEEDRQKDLLSYLETSKFLRPGGMNLFSIDELDIMKLRKWDDPPADDDPNFRKMCTIMRAFVDQTNTTPSSQSSSAGSAGSQGSSGSVSSFPTLGEPLHSEHTSKKQKRDSSSGSDHTEV